MFEITNTDVSNLGDADLRELVARLARAELQSQGCPASSVRAGGNQDAADGGVDVQVECPTEIAKPDFVARPITGFQVKKPDMPPAEIKKEMRPKGTLRDVIRDLAERSGAYVIISAQGSVAAGALRGCLKNRDNLIQKVKNGLFRVKFRDECLPLQPQRF